MYYYAYFLLYTCTFIWIFYSTRFGAYVSQSAKIDSDGKSTRVFEYCLTFEVSNYRSSEMSKLIDIPIRYTSRTLVWLAGILDPGTSNAPYID